ncbi:hypothetical protein [Enterococcus mundtii]|uniref:hypothetical protein n=1 Tax=Enterococcus mundtii TaxID=53346 RepID=UPI001963F9FD|nr:hypothetical protein [Enterococcus mundtii]
MNIALGKHGCLGTLLLFQLFRFPYLVEIRFIHYNKAMTVFPEKNLLMTNSHPIPSANNKLYGFIYYSII